MIHGRLYRQRITAIGNDLTLQQSSRTNRAIYVACASGSLCFARRA
jgi:hypothetical protein